MVGQSGDLGVSGYVPEQADGAIGYVEYSYALETGFPVAKVLNAAGYYTEPTPGHVAVSLLKAQINTDKSSAALPDPGPVAGLHRHRTRARTSCRRYSYMILPTDTSISMTTAKGNTLGAFGSYLLCRASSRWTRSATRRCRSTWSRPASTQLQKIPGNQMPTETTARSPELQQPDLLHQRHEHPGRHRPASAGVRQAGHRRSAPRLPAGARRRPAPAARRRRRQLRRDRRLRRQRGGRSNQAARRRSQHRRRRQRPALGPAAGTSATGAATGSRPGASSRPAVTRTPAPAARPGTGTGSAPATAPDRRSLRRAEHRRSATRRPCGSNGDGLQSR